MPDVQVLHSADYPLVTKRPRNICIRVHDDWQSTHPAEVKIVLRKLGLVQPLAHDFAFSTTERVLSSRRAVAVKPTTTHHQVSS